MRTILASLLVLAACGGSAVCGGCGDGDPIEALPDTFAVEATVGEVTGGTDTAREACTPAPSDGVWRVTFARMHDTDEPTFRSDPHLTKNPDDAAACQGAHEPYQDCCDPMVAEDGAAVLRCSGSMAGSFVQHFEFRFNADGGGSSTTTRVYTPSGNAACVAHASWSTIVPL